MAEPGAWQACQIAALLAFAVGVAARRRRGERALPIALGVVCAGAFACLLDPLLRLPAAIVGNAREPLFRGVIVSYGALGGLVAGVVIAEKARARRSAAEAPHPGPPPAADSSPVSKENLFVGLRGGRFRGALGSRAFFRS